MAEGEDYTPARTAVSVRREASKLLVRWSFLRGIAYLGKPIWKASSSYVDSYISMSFYREILTKRNDLGRICRSIQNHSSAMFQGALIKVDLQGLIN
jgi:hypothetical protein